MPSRAEFLAGLTAPTDPPEENCSICYNPWTDAVSLPCAHVFDRECIETWLNGPGVNTCPTCRAVLFDLPQQQHPADQTAHPQPQNTEPGTPTHRALLRRALRLSGLQEDRSDQRNTLETLTFGPYTEAEIYDASVAVARFLSRGGGQTEQGEFFLNTPEGGREVVRGMAVLDALDEVLLARIIAFVHLIPAMSTSAGRPYSEPKLRDWQVLMILLKDELEARHGQPCDVNLLADQLRARIAARLSEFRQDFRSTFLASHEEMGGLNLDRLDLDLVLDYVGFVFWKEQLDR